MGALVQGVNEILSGERNALLSSKQDIHPVEADEIFSRRVGDKLV
jgi:hypothetical protein